MYVNFKRYFNSNFIKFMHKRQGQYEHKNITPVPPHLL